MSPLPLGILAASGASAAFASSFDLLESKILTDTPTSITFSNLISAYSADYQHLQLRYHMWTNTNTQDINMRFNGDAGANYSEHVIYGGGSGSPGGYAYNNYIRAAYYSPGYGGQLDAFAIWDLQNFANTTKYKTVTGIKGNNPFQSNIYGVIMHSGHWRNNSAVDSWSLVSTGGGAFQVGNRFSLYGIKVA